MTSSQKRILMWAVPRSVSSAMCRAMMNSGLKTQILFEPYGYSYYFGPERSSNRYPDVYSDPKYSYETIKQSFELPYTDKELVFAKDMPYYLEPDHLTADWVPDGYTHTFIIRHPRSTVASYYKVIDKQLSGWEDFDPRELGFKEQLEMFHILQDQGHKVVVMDAEDLTENPEGMLRAFCQEVGLEYQDSMIHWAPLSEEDYKDVFSTVWEDEWFTDLKQATGLDRRPRCPGKLDRFFAKYDQSTQDFVSRTVAENMKYYEEMHNMRLVVKDE